MRHRRPSAQLAAAGALAAIVAIAGCAAPERPAAACRAANAALAVTNVGWTDAGFRVTVVNQAPQPIRARIFLEAAIVVADRPLLAGTTATDAAWPATGEAVIAFPFTVDDRPISGGYEVFTHLKCLSSPD